MLCDCGHEESPHESITRGYGTDKDGKTHCYACCADQERAWMRERGRSILYLTHHPFPQAGYPYTDGELTDWPGQLRFACLVKRGRHNIAGSRYDVWFRFEGHEWHGVQYGEHTQICHVRRLKTKVA